MIAFLLAIILSMQSVLSGVGSECTNTYESMPEDVEIVAYLRWTGDDHTVVYAQCFVPDDFFDWSYNRNN